MTNSQSNRLNMYETLVLFVTQTLEISGLRPGLIAAKNTLAGLVEVIHETAAKQSTQTGGISTDKKDEKEELAQAIFQNTTGASSYAASTGNDTLKEEMNYSLSELGKLPDDDISQVATNVKNILTPLLDESLAGFGVDADTVADMETANGEFLNAKNKPRMAIVVKSAQTEMLIDLFEQADKTVHDVMDPVALTLKKDHPEWYIEYHNSGKIIDLGTRHTTAEGDCVVSGSGDAIYNALVTLSSVDHPTVITKSLINGHWKVIPIKHGVWSLTVEHPDFDTVHIGAFQIKLGESVFKQINMVPKSA